MAPVTRAVATLLLFICAPQLAAALVGCGPGSTVQLTYNQRSCNIVEFGNCSVALSAGEAMLALLPSATCAALPNSGMALSVTTPTGMVEACATPTSLWVWITWVSSTEQDLYANTVLTLKARNRSNYGKPGQGQYYFARGVGSTEWQGRIIL